jgi:hypothetical protein
MGRTAPRRLIALTRLALAATLAVAGVVALPMPASAGDCLQKDQRVHHKYKPPLLATAGGAADLAADSACTALGPSTERHVR